jgi:hypothetical protein
MLPLRFSSSRLVSAARGSSVALPRRALASNSSGAPLAAGTNTSTTTSTNSTKLNTAADREAYLKEANKQMQKYHDTRELMKAGKLVSKNQHRGPKNAAGAQMAVVGLFLAAFLSMPFLGKKIAQDDEFRAKWIPAFYDFTVKKPENPWTREELHEQMLQIQQDIRSRAIRGEFTPEKLQQMKGSLEGLDYPERSGMERSKIPKEWTKIHPGLDDDEELNEA